MLGALSVSELGHQWLVLDQAADGSGAGLFHSNCLGGFGRKDAVVDTFGPDNALCPDNDNVEVFKLGESSTLSLFRGFSAVIVVGGHGNLPSGGVATVVGVDPGDGWESLAGHDGE